MRASSQTWIEALAACLSFSLGLIIGGCGPVVRGGGGGSDPSTGGQTAGTGAGGAGAAGTGGATGGAGNTGGATGGAGGEGTTSSGCADGLTACGGACVDLAKDVSNCGACGQACMPDQGCNGGDCGILCAPGQSVCDGACASLDMNPANCGSCGNACAPGLACVGGACGCPLGEVACDGACVDPSADPAHCGASGSCQGASAGIACAAGQFCVNGLCAVTCPAGETACGGACVDLANDNLSCGACGAPCGLGSACLGGACSVAGQLYQFLGSVYQVDTVTGALTYAGPIDGLLGYSGRVTYDGRNDHYYYTSGDKLALIERDMSWHAVFPGSPPPTGALVYDRDKDLLWAIRGGQFVLLSPWKNQIVTTPAQPPGSIAALALDPHHHRVYALSGPFLFRYEIATDQWTIVADTGLDFGSDPAGSDGLHASITYDPSGEDLYVSRWDNASADGQAGKVWRLDPATGALTLLHDNMSSGGPVLWFIPGDATQCVPHGGTCGLQAICQIFENCAELPPPPGFPDPELACVPSDQCTP